MKKDKENKQEKKLEELKEQTAQNLAGWQKALADYQNLQREMDQRLSGMNDYATSACIVELLPIFDNYQMALTHIPQGQKKEQWAIGLEHILKMWESFLNDHNVEKIKTVGQEFDPNFHEAVAQLEDKKQKDQIILEEKMAGYKIKNKVLRPAKVIINNKNN